mgnify:CR=1 FL=1
MHRGRDNGVLPAASKIIFADIPRNPTGKIEKPKLRKIYCGESLVAKQNHG